MTTKTKTYDPDEELEALYAANCRCIRRVAEESGVPAARIAREELDRFRSDRSCRFSHDEHALFLR